MSKNAQLGCKTTRPHTPSTNYRLYFTTHSFQEIQCGDWTPSDSHPPAYLIHFLQEIQPASISKWLPSTYLPHTFPSGNPMWRMNTTHWQETPIHQLALYISFRKSNKEREPYPPTHNSYPPNYLLHFPQEIQHVEWTPPTTKQLPSTRLPHTFPSGNPAQRARPCVTEQRAAPPSRPWPPEEGSLGPVADSAQPSAAPLGGQDRWRGAGTCRSAGSPVSRRRWAGQRSAAQRRQLHVGEILGMLAQQMDHQSADFTCSFSKSSNEWMDE